MKDWRVQFTIGMVSSMLLSVISWAWLGPFASTLVAGAAFAAGAMWRQAHVELDEAAKP